MPNKYPPTALYAKNGIKIGVIVLYPDGYRFLPRTDARKPSRKGYPTPEACIPCWAAKLAATRQAHDLY